TDRLTATLERLKVPMRRLLVNMVVPTEAAESCAFCQARRQAQGDVLAEFARSFKHALYVAPQQPHEVRGREELRAHFAEWRCGRCDTSAWSNISRAVRASCLCGSARSSWRAVVSSRCSRSAVRSCKGSSNVCAGAKSGA